jgi:hypothetical protein
MRALCMVVLAWLLTTASAAAHTASDAYVQVARTDDGVAVRWDVALRDLDAVMPLDSDVDGRLTWGELRRALPALAQHVLPQLQMPGCALLLRDTTLEQRGDGMYLAWHLHAPCTPPDPVALRYRFMAGIDATHRAIASIRTPDGRTEARVLVHSHEAAAASRPAAPGEADPVESASGVPSAAAPGGFVQEGMRHLLGGFDHLLFLACLLLPAALRREDGRWRPMPRARDALRPTVRVVTLFTVAHSTTMVLAALGHVRLAPAIVEPLIAATIAAAALDNVVPLFGRWRDAVTFGFGFVHGFGFAGVLAELALPTREFGLALLQFNLGLELAQLGVVVLAVPVLVLFSRRPAYARWALPGASLAATALAIAWFAERLGAGGQA